MSRLGLLICAKLVAFLFTSSFAWGDFNVSVNIVDPTSSFQSYYAAITSHAIASGRLWGSHFAGTTNLELEVVLITRFLAPQERALRLPLSPTEVASIFLSRASRLKFARE